MPRKRSANQPKLTPRPAVSESLGCIESQVEEFRAEAQLTGFSGIEFVPDSLEPGAYNCVASSRSEMLRYARSQGYVDHGTENGSAGVLSPQVLADAERLIRRKYGVR